MPAQAGHVATHALAILVTIAVAVATVFVAHPQPIAPAASGIPATPNPATAEVRAPPVEPRQTAWRLVITNRGSDLGYPPNVTGGNVYQANVSVSFDVPIGQTGVLTLALESVLSNPPPVRQVTLNSPENFSIAFGSGTHVFAKTLNASAPVVHRDSFASADIDAHLLSGGNSVASDSYGFDVNVLPVDLAQDVIVNATIGSLIRSIGSQIRGIGISIDFVEVDPWGVLVQGKQMVVLSDGLPQDLALRDTVHVRGDFYPAEDPNIFVWTSAHYVNRTGTRNREPALTNPVVDPPWGHDDTIFRFSVQYADPDGDPPDVILAIDNVQIPMVFRSGDNTSGATFDVSRTLAVGDHPFRFLANDRIGAPNSTNGTAAFVVTVRSAVVDVLHALLFVVPAAAVANGVYVYWKVRRDTEAARAKREEKVEKPKE